MKVAIITPFLLFLSLLAFSQGSTVSFDFLNGKPVTNDAITNLKLPLKFSFTEKFNGKSVKFLVENGAQVIALNNSKFGTGDLSKDGETNTFHIVITADRKVNPGDEKVNSDKFILQIEQTKLPIALDTADLGGKTLKEEEEYDAGYIYYDALKLIDNKSSDRLILDILKAYKVDVSNVGNNPYLNDVFGEFLSGRPQGGGVPALLTNLGNADVTNFAVGLARFLAERSKDELNEAFFNKMKEQLKAYPELETVFPKTTSFLNTIETYSYASVIQVLKEAFETDIQNLPGNLYEIKNLDTTDCSDIAKAKHKKNCEERLARLKVFFETQDGRWIGLGLFTLKESVQSSNPANLLKSVIEATEFKSVKDFSKTKSNFADYNVASSIELGNLLSQSLISKDEKQIWITASELSSLFKTQNAFKVYLGLLLANEINDESKIDFYKQDSSTISFEKILRNEFIKYTDLETLIKNAHSAYDAANNAVKKISAANEKLAGADPQALYEYYRTFSSSLKAISQNTLLNTITGRDLGAEYAKVEQYLNPAVDIAYHISTKKYSAAVYDAVLLLDNIKTPAFEKPVIKNFVKYGTLISTVATAQSSDEVKAALEASVLPVGSSSIKRKSAWSISLNGYVGAFYGKARSTIQDTLRNTDTNKLDTISKPTTYRTFGLYAPVGISFNRGFKCGWGISLSAQILDLGALVNFYLTEGDKASLPTDFKVKLSDILSPGAQLAINIPKTPLTLMGGIQYVPALNNSEQISSASLSPIAWRTQIGIVVDIPFYNFKVWDFRK